MNRKILFLGSGSPFIVNALKGNLTKAGYEVISVEPNSRAIGKTQGKFFCAVVFLGDALLIHKDNLTSLSKLCREESLPLLVIGTQEELDIASKSIPDAVIAARFEKPLKIKEFISRIDTLNELHPGQNKAPKQPRQILLVDDDTDYLKLVCRWLSGQYRVVVVKSGVQAISFLSSNRPDLILLDYNMPVTSGPQVLEMIRSEKNMKDIPVFFLTGKDDRESVNRVLEMKPNGYILKSVDRNSLLERLEEFFAGQN